MSKNMHMVHLEDSIINGGVDGTRCSINFLRYLRDLLGGKTEAPVSVSVKWDGSPAIFAGTDPSDGEFFIAKKGIFNKNPKIYKTFAEIDSDLKPELAEIFKTALVQFSKLDIKGVVQGDFLYTKKDIKTIEIDGDSYITFHPNTIVYAIPENSELAETILRSNIGVVWHTTYRGKTFETMSASFGESIAKDLKKVDGVWCIDATYESKAEFTKSETVLLTSILSLIGSLFNHTKKEALEELSTDPELNKFVNRYINSYIRQGIEVCGNPEFILGMYDYIKAYYEKAAECRLTEKGKLTQLNKMNSTLSYFSRHTSEEIEKVFTIYGLIVNAKHAVINKMNNTGSIRTFLKTMSGYQPTGQEGFVAINEFGNTTFKLVNRLEFSHANFSPSFLKGWQ